MAVAVKSKTSGFVTKNNTLTSGITKQDSTQDIVTYLQHYSYDGIMWKVAFQTTTLLKSIAADAALAFGEHLFTLPTAVVKPIAATLVTTNLCPAGLSATAGEYGLGTVIGSGANATIGAVGATSENIMEGTTISNQVAATTLTMKLHNHPVLAFDHGAGTISSGTNPGAGVIDATAGTSKVFLNLASTWDQTAAESVAFSAKGVLYYMVLGADFGIE